MDDNGVPFSKFDDAVQYAEMFGKDIVEAIENFREYDKDWNNMIHDVMTNTSSTAMSCLCGLCFLPRKPLKKESLLVFEAIRISLAQNNSWLMFSYAKKDYVRQRFLLRYIHYAPFTGSVYFVLERLGT